MRKKWRKKKTKDIDPNTSLKKGSKKLTFNIETKIVNKETI